MTTSQISPEAFIALVEAHIPLSQLISFEVERLEAGLARLRVPFRGLFVRPGGTISGPILMTAADTALLAATLSLTGAAQVPVTSQLNVHFLRRPAPVALLAEARVLRAGRALITGEVLLYSEGDPEPVCLATGAYARPNPGA
jgi:uncharacterized protein (TIGR00369 family)